MASQSEKALVVRLPGSVRRPYNRRQKLTWSKLDFTGQTILIKVFTDYYGSFSMACMILKLTLDEAIEFRDRYIGEVIEYEAQYTEAFWLQDAQLDDSEQMSVLGLKHIHKHDVAPACMFLKSVKLRELAKSVQAYGGTTLDNWPLFVDMSDVRSLELNQTVLVSTMAEDDDIDDDNDDWLTFRGPMASDDRTVVNLVCTVEQGVQSPKPFVQLTSFVLPPGCVCHGPHGTRKFLAGGRYEVCLPKRNAPGRVYVDLALARDTKVTRPSNAICGPRPQGNDIPSQLPDDVFF
ncbi:hypothetical protein F5Y18DRAFT_439514 [Xylariaceae sp. FL1019]|nr:hypothetical protein F5Y18DRAFT_439514 [Xylariaceae sp. FL1019]